MNRRELLTAMAGVTALPSAFALSDNDKESDYQRYRRSYEYEARQQSQQSNSVIQNNILPSQTEDFWSRPRRIFLQREVSGERAEIFYYHDGGLNSQQYWLASYLLRDVKYKKMVYMDPKLLDLICAVQAWLSYYGIHEPIRILSGFRTWEHNLSLVQGREGAAKDSMHLYGKAVDFTIPGLNINSIANIAARFKAGGIGLYPNNNFLHLDTGGVRVWTKK